MESKRSSRSLKAIARVICIASAAMLFMGGSPTYAQGWHFGVGSGFTWMNIQGDEGYNIANYGPVQYELDLDPDDISDVLESAFGFAGYASNGTWMIQYSLGWFTLGGEGTVDLPAEVGGGTLDIDLDYDVTNIKVAVGRTVYRSQNMKFSFTPYVGLRYLKHDISADFVINQGGEHTPVYRGRDWNWTDALVGVGVGYQLRPKLSWNAGGDAGFGGSDGTFFFTTNLTVSPTRHFSFGPNFSYTALDYENGNKGDADWYLYDADEFGVGIFAVVNF